jgi:DhnA family fructose-bisphosphate aldolase class Ia
MLIPADVPQSAHSTYLENYKVITKNTDRLMLFAADQKIEHLNKDFYGSFIHPEANNPKHLFEIAKNGRIGAFATQFGLISRYAHQYKDIDYIVKMNSKTNLISLEYKDPLSTCLWTISDIINLKESSNLKIRGIGYTIYLGSEFEHIMLSEAAKIITDAHKHGLITILWIYPRGKYIKDKDDIDLIPGATGIANALGADFVKIKTSQNDLIMQMNILKIASKSAGNTKIICSGGESKPTDIFLKTLYEQISIGGTNGNATGRNIFQRSLSDAIAFTNAISSIVYDNKSYDEAIKIYESMSS